MTVQQPIPAGLRRRLADIVQSTTSPQERAVALLDALSRSLLFDAGWLAVRDPEQHRHIPLATVGPVEPLRRYFSTPAADVEVEQLGLNGRRPPVLASELPAPLPEVRAWGEYLLPAGFRNGLAVGLFSRGGRHVGFLSLLSAEPGRPDTGSRDVVASVADLIADGLDRAPDITDATRIVRAAEAGVILTRGGEVLPLPGIAGHPLLARGSAVLAAAADELAEGGRVSSFLAPAPGPHDESLLRVTAVNCARPDLDHLAAAVLLSPPGELHGLTPRDLRVLGLVAAGVTRPADLRARLRLDDRSVADALAAARVVLQVSDPTAVATHAIRTGLRISPRLGTPASG